MPTSLTKSSPSGDRKGPLRTTRPPPGTLQSAIRNPKSYSLALLPLVSAAVALLVILYDPRLVGIVLMFAFTPGGEVTAVVTAVALLHTPPPIVTLLVVTVDAWWSILVVMNFEVAKRIPYVGGFIVKVERAGVRAYRRRGWLRAVGWTGLTLFMALPMQGTGAIATSVLGRATGMGPLKTFLAVITGSGGRTAVIAYLTYYGMAGLRGLVGG